MNHEPIIEKVSIPRTKLQHKATNSRRAQHRHQDFTATFEKEKY
jgi:hypothetical protein